MKNNKLFLRFAVLVTAMMCALGAAAVEAYANYTSSNTTLTFYYDNYRSSRTGTTYGLNTGTTNPGWESDGTNANVTKVVFDQSFINARPTTTYHWFNYMTNLESIEALSCLNTSEVNNMAYMFHQCTSLTSINASYFNTSKVTNMSYMFTNCNSLLTSLDLSSFNTSKVTNMSYMFSGCTNLRTIYVSSIWSTVAVTSSSGMFYNCTKLMGGQGTTYSSSNPMDKTYAHVDGGYINPGYFTAETETYACYTPSNTTLTFYYDKLRSSRSGTTYDLNTGSNEAGWDTDDTKYHVTKVVFDPSFADARPTTTCDWFYCMINLQSITGLNYLNTSNVTNMSYMFLGCTTLTSLDLRSFNTSKVTSMYSMFTDCTNLQTIYVGSDWNTAAVTSSELMFKNCTSLVGGQGTTYSVSKPTDKAYAHIDGGPSNPGYFTQWKEAYACYTPSNTTLTFYYDTQRDSRTGTTYDLNEGYYVPYWETDGINANVSTVVFDPSFADARPTSTASWFEGMLNLETITGLNYLNTSEVTNMYGMFVYCSGLTSVDLSSFNTSKVTNMYAMFAYCSGLTSVDLSSFNTSKVANMSYMFYGCTNLRTISVGSGWSTAAVTNSVGMFDVCTSLVGGQGTAYNDSNPKDKTYAHIDGGTSNPGYFTAAGTEAYACYTPSNTTLTFYYDNQRDSRTGTTYDLNTNANKPGWNTDNCCNSVSTVVFDRSFAVARPTSTCWWFGWMGNLTSIVGIEHLNTSEVTNMSNMFSTCWSMEEFDLSHFDTGNVTDMSYMFNYCEGLTSLDLSSFNTSNVYTMEGMFYECSGLSSLDLSGFDTEHVSNFNEMFFDCAGLGSLDLRSFDTQGAQTMEGMFLDCSGLTSIDLSSFNTEHVDNMNSMFSGCSNLTTLDLASFNTSYLLVTDLMFYYCRNLRTIYVGDDWDTGSLDSSEGMFSDCVSLVGGQGTTYNESNPKDATYAHIDGGTSNPGYFTAKNAGLRGDADGDGEVSISDVSKLTDYLLTGNASGVNLAGADADQDGEVAIADVSAIIDYLLSGNW